VTSVRPAVPTDYLAMIDVLAAAKFHEHANQLERASARGEDVEDGWFVAVVGSRVVGVACAQLALDYSDLITALGFEPPHTFISAIAVDAECRGRGVGRILLIGVAEAGAVRGSRYLALVPAPPDNRGSDPVAFFRRCGLTPFEAQIEGVPTRHGAPITALAAMD
jgi:GNAT superfamily N-acetyltransferase